MIIEVYLSAFKQLLQWVIHTKLKSTITECKQFRSFITRREGAHYSRDISSLGHHTEALFKK